MSPIKAVIWDLDNTLYKFSDDYMAACDWASAKAFVECGVPMTLQEAYEASRESFAKYKMHGSMLIERYKLDPSEYFDLYHRFLDEKSIGEVFNLNNFFKKSQTVHAILSHGSYDWIKRALAYIGIKEFFDDERIVAFEHYDFKHKSVHRDGFDLILNKLGMPAKEIVFVEDSYKNLKIAKEMGLITILVTHGLGDIPTVDYIDHYVETPAEVFTLLS